MDERINRIENCEMTDAMRSIWNSFVPYITEESRITETSPVISGELHRIYRIKFIILTEAKCPTFGFSETLEALQCEEGGIKVICILGKGYQGFCFTDSEFKRIVGVLYLERKGIE